MNSLLIWRKSKLENMRLNKSWKMIVNTCSHLFLEQHKLLKLGPGCFSSFYWFVSGFRINVSSARSWGLVGSLLFWEFLAFRACSRDFSGSLCSPQHTLLVSVLFVREGITMNFGPISMISRKVLAPNGCLLQSSTLKIYLNPLTWIVPCSGYGLLSYSWQV